MGASAHGCRNDVRNIQRRDYRRFSATSTRVVVAVGRQQAMPARVDVPPVLGHVGQPVEEVKDLIVGGVRDVVRAPVERPYPFRSSKTKRAAAWPTGFSSSTMVVLGFQ